MLASNFNEIGIRRKMEILSSFMIVKPGIMKRSGIARIFGRAFDLGLKAIEGNDLESIKEFDEIFEWIVRMFL